ncbi:hypothetical protein KSS87_000551 [Heliosperma pusillum]|nr:hypothetical protein KSS87_000551 [Heliosperma pusillum]
MAGAGEVIDVDSYIASKAIGKMKQAGGVIDLDFDGILQNVNVTSVNTNSYSRSEIIDVDSYVFIDDDNEKTNRGNADGGSSSNASIFENAAPANGQASVKTDCKEQIHVSNKKLKTAINTQKAPVEPDQCVPDDIKNAYHGDAVYDAMLTQTNIENNTNDFYVIQVLKANHADSYTVYNRWGIVGEHGEIKLTGPHSCCFIAIQEFEEIFYAKTKNHWSDRKKFVSYPKCYTWLEMNYRRKSQAQLSLPCAGDRTYGPVVEKFMSLICNFSVMTQQMTDIGYDAQKLPLQNLSKSTILKAYDVLALIAEVMGESNRKLLEELSGEFYTIIPHVFGDKSMRQFIIDTREKLRSKLEMVESLGEIEIASKLLNRCAGQQVDVMYAQYKLLRCALAPVGATSREYEMIENYMKNTALNTRAEIVQIFRVSKEGENERLKKYSHVKNRMMLWHGSRLTNWLSILSQGLRIAPKEVPLSGASFGRGIYFADMFDKSAMYCNPRSATGTWNSSSVANAGTAILLLCEVVLGEMRELQGHHSFQAHEFAGGNLSVKAIGTTAPSEYKVLEEGVIFPTGKAVTTSKSGARSHNEYVVYSEDRVRMRYVVQVNYNHQR